MRGAIRALLRTRPGAALVRCEGGALTAHQVVMRDRDGPTRCRHGR